MSGGDGGDNGHRQEGREEIRAESSLKQRTSTWSWSKHHLLKQTKSEKHAAKPQNTDLSERETVFLCQKKVKVRRSNLVKSLTELSLTDWTVSFHKEGETFSPNPLIGVLQTDVVCLQTGNKVLVMTEQKTKKKKTYNLFATQSARAGNIKWEEEEIERRRRKRTVIWLMSAQQQTVRRLNAAPPSSSEMYSNVSITASPPLKNAKLRGTSPQSRCCTTLSLSLSLWLVTVRWCRFNHILYRCRNHGQIPG